MLSLLINGDGLVSKSLETRLRAHAHEVVSFRLPEHSDSAAATMEHFERFAESGKYYRNIYLDLTDSYNEIAEFSADANSARIRLERRLKEVLKVLKYGSQHLARSADGGRIWVLCYDHSVNFSVSSPSNPITNYAVMAAVQSIAKEVAHLDVQVNVFMIHPPKESVDMAEWKQAKNNLKVYGLKYKPQPVDHISETLHMYAELKNLTTTGGVIPLGSGIALSNY
jgi:hypothetical protein